MLSPSHNTPILAILFDMDGTLLRARMSEFIPRYVESLAGYCADYVKPKRFIKAKLRAIRELINHEGDGSMTNEERMYDMMSGDLNIPSDIIRESFVHFRDNGLDQLQELIRPIPLARQIAQDCRKRGIPMVLATNPVFPRFMITARLSWGGLDESLFDLITSYENSRHCKPQAGYFSDIADQLGIPARNCLMVGNDLNHDLAALAVGMQAFLVDTWVVEHGAPEWPCANRGDHQALQKFLARHLQDGRR